MGILSRTSLEQYLLDGKLSFDPVLDQFQLRPHSIDLRLGYTFMVPRAWTMTRNGREAIKINMSTLDDPQSTYPVELKEGQYFELLPNELVVATVLERITMPTNVMAILYPRSSLNRKGLSIDLTGIVDAGYEGNLIVPIENKNEQPVRIYPGERFCQLTFQELDREIDIEKSRWHKAKKIMGAKKEKNNVEKDLIEKGNISKLKEKYPFIPAKQSRDQ